MNELKLGAVDEKFADIVWSNAPISTGELVKRCASQLNWKRPTVYSALRKFCDNGIFKTEDSTVTVLITKEQLHGMQSAKFVDEVFGGSLPAFIAAFSSRKKLTDKESDTIQRMIDEAKEVR